MRKRRLLARFFNRRRQTLGLGAMALMAGLLFWGRLLMQDVPRTAIADPETQLVQRAAPSHEVHATKPAPLPAPERDLFRFENPTPDAMLNRAK
ncbi:MAG: hypothetical protein WD294_09935 [Phycisphaeraceae bacterium]